MNIVIFTENKLLQNRMLLADFDLIPVKIIFDVDSKADQRQVADAKMLIENFDVDELHKKLYELSVDLRKAHTRIDELEMQTQNNLKPVAPVESFEAVAAASPFAVRKLTKSQN